MQAKVDYDVDLGVFLSTAPWRCHGKSIEKVTDASGVTEAASLILPWTMSSGQRGLTSEDQSSCRDFQRECTGQVWQQLFETIFFLLNVRNQVVWKS